MAGFGSKFCQLAVCSGNGTEGGGAEGSEVGELLWPELKEKVLMTRSQLKEKHDALSGEAEGEGRLAEERNLRE